jgi:aldehyde dehydrogenase
MSTATTRTTSRADVISAATVGPQRYAAVHNPARAHEVVGEYALADAAAVDRVVAACAAAAPLWAGLTGAERGRLLADAATLIDSGSAERAQLLTTEQGKVLWESRLDVGGAPFLLRYYAELAERAAAEELIEDERGTSIIRRLPIGPTVVIVPWNAPVYLCMMSLAPALAAGNPVIVKPSEFAPLVLTEVLETLSRALPPGVLSVVPGLGAEAGTALVAHEQIRKVVFTGGTTTAREVLRTAAPTIKSVSMELGGNDPAIVLDSAVVDDELVSQLRHAVFTTSGQVCFNVKRIYVQRSIHDEFLARFREAVDEIAVGDGLDPRATIGPLINRTQLDRARGFVERARAAGAGVEELGTRLDHDAWDGGHYMAPMIATGLPHDSELVRVEQFAPVIPIVPFDELEQALAWANDSEYGLAASIWSADSGHALEVARRIEAGSVFVNSHRIGSSDMSLPFGGIKQSGLGRNHGMWAIDECSELQAISHRPGKDFPGPHNT